MIYLAGDHDSLWIEIEQQSSGPPVHARQPDEEGGGGQHEGWLLLRRLEIGREIAKRLDVQVGERRKKREIFVS